MVEIANRPIGPLPWVNWYLMDVLITALSNDPAARPSAARFRDQLANVPVPRMSKRGLHIGAGETTSSAFPHGRSVVPGHSAPSNNHSIAVTAVTADSQRAPGQVASAEAPPLRRNRRASIPALAAALVIGMASASAWLISQPPSSIVSAAMKQSAAPGGGSSSAGPSPASNPEPPTSTTTPGADDTTGSGSAEQVAIQLEDPAASAKPFQTVRIQGIYRGGADILLRVQRWEGGKWLAFPLPAKTDRSGQFTAFVELGQPGRYQVRVLDPGTGATSKPSQLVIMG
jgi:hypothetical protein